MIYSDQKKRLGCCGGSAMGDIGTDVANVVGESVDLIATIFGGGKAKQAQAQAQAQIAMANAQAQAQQSQTTKTIALAGVGVLGLLGVALAVIKSKK